MKISSLIVLVSMLRTAVSYISRSAVTRRSRAFVPTRSIVGTSSSSRFMFLEGEADIMEQLVGGERYSMVPLPDIMASTTLFVGNLCQFVHDDEISQLFSTAHLVPPACVCRKPNRDSMEYGFVYFPTMEEKEAALIRFDGYEWNNRKLKVQPIIDHPTYGRVRVPEKFVAFVCGPVKRASRSYTKDKSLRRVSRDDVDRLSRGQPSKKKGFGSRNVAHRLNDEERAEFDRAARKGFLVVNGSSGVRRARKGSPLINIHRQWCDARAKPQIIVYKTSNGRMGDILVVDISPVRLHGLDNVDDANELTVQWRGDISTAAAANEMDLTTAGNNDDDDDDDKGEEEAESDESLVECNNEDDIDESDCVNGFLLVVDEKNPEAWATRPIWQLPTVPLGKYIGTRSNAKAMAKELATLWEIPEINAAPGDGPKNRRQTGAKHGGKTKVKGISEHRRQRGGGHRQATW